MEARRKPQHTFPPVQSDACAHTVGPPSGNVNPPSGRGGGVNPPSGTLKHVHCRVVPPFTRRHAHIVLPKVQLPRPVQSVPSCGAVVGHTTCPVPPAPIWPPPAPV